MVVANLVNQEATGFEADENEVVLVLSTGETIPLSRAPKREIADRIFDQVLKLRLALHAATMDAKTNFANGWNSTTTSESKRSIGATLPDRTCRNGQASNHQPQPCPCQARTRARFSAHDPRTTSAIAIAAACTKHRNKIVFGVGQ